MSTRPRGFDPNQQRADDGKWEKQVGSRPESGTLTKRPVQEWPEDAWPADDPGMPCVSCGTAEAVPGDGRCQACLDRETAAMPDETGAARSCRECGRPVTGPGKLCQRCVDLHARLDEEYPIEDEHAQAQAAADREKAREAEWETWDLACACGQPALYHQVTCGRPACEAQQAEYDARAKAEQKEIDRDNAAEDKLAAADGAFDAEYERTGDITQAKAAFEAHLEQQTCTRCGQPHHANGLCKRHYDEQRYGTTGIGEGSRTPWGAGQTATEIAPGIASVHTAGHGGYKLTPERNKLVPAPFRNRSGWYEEDHEWRAVGVTFPEALATERSGMTAEQVREVSDIGLREWSPDEWEKWSGRTIQPGESRKRDERVWTDAHADQFVSASLSKSVSDPDMRIVTARRLADGVEAEYLVSADEYTEGSMDRPGEYGRAGRFVIDPSRHPRLPDVPDEKPTKVDVRLADDDVAPLRESGTAKSQERIAKDLRQRWRTRDGNVRTLEELLKEEGVHHKTVYVTDKGTSQYSLVQADGSSLRVSRQTWMGLSNVKDGRSPSEQWNQEIHRTHAKIEKTQRAIETGETSYRNGRVRLSDLNLEIDRLRSLRKQAEEKERKAYEAEHGTREQREQRKRDAQAERERQARVTDEA